MSSQAQPLNFGLLIVPGYQLLDAAGPVDYIHNHSRAAFSTIPVSPITLAKSPHIIWHYISPDPSLKPIQPTSGPAQIPTCSFADCPDLDYLIVPAPESCVAPLPEGCKEFFQNLMAKESFKALLTICTGSIFVAQTGVLDGLNVCSNKYMLKVLAESGQLRKEVKWVGDRRWVVDGKVWSGAGITAGIDLAAEFARVHFAEELVDIVKDTSEYTPLPAKPDVFARILDGVSL